MRPAFLEKIRHVVASFVLRDHAAETADRLAEVDRRLDTQETAGLEQAARLVALHSEIQALQRELEIRVEAMEARVASVELRVTSTETDAAAGQARLTAFEERLRRLEPSAVSVAISDDPDAARDNLLNIRLGELESRILTVLEGPYFERVAGLARGARADADPGVGSAS